MEVHNQDSVQAAECLYADSQSSSVVPGWDSLIPDNSVLRSLLALVAQCIRLGRRRADVPWEWALQDLLRRRLRVRDLPVVPAHHLGGRGSAMFPVG